MLSTASSTTTSSSGTRRLAGAQCALFSLSLLAAGLHQATAIHGYCSEHGQLIHIPVAALLRLEHRETDRSVVSRDTLLRGAHGCALLHFLGQSKALDPDQGVVADSRPAPLAATWQEEPTPAVIPLLRQAPKNSPPA